MSWYDMCNYVIIIECVGAFINLPPIWIWHRFASIIIDNEQDVLYVNELPLYVTHYRVNWYDIVGTLLKEAVFESEL